MGIAVEADFRNKADSTADLVLSTAFAIDGVASVEAFPLYALSGIAAARLRRILVRPG
jgi:hypothetical protein